MAGILMAFIIVCSIGLVFSGVIETALYLISIISPRFQVLVNKLADVLLIVELLLCAIWIIRHIWQLSQTGFLIGTPITAWLIVVFLLLSVPTVITIYRKGEKFYPLYLVYFIGFVLIFIDISLSIAENMV